MSEGKLHCDRCDAEVPAITVTDCGDEKLCEDCWQKRVREDATMFCPVCGAEEKSHKWRFVAGPGGGGWMCDCGAMWRSWQPKDILDRKES